MRLLVLAWLACNQVLYDQLYREIILQAIRTEDIEQKNNTIETLRKLCNGQLSSYERGKPWKQTTLRD